MALYEYVCTEGHRFTRLRPMEARDAEAICWEVIPPDDKHLQPAHCFTPARRVLSASVSIHIK